MRVIGTAAPVVKFTAPPAQTLLDMSLTGEPTDARVYAVLASSSAPGLMLTLWPLKVTLLASFAA